MPKSVACPRCGSYNPPKPKVAHGQIELPDSFSPSRYAGYYSLVNDARPRIAIIQCGSCEEPFVADISSESFPTPLWPLKTPSTPEGVPPEVAEAYKDARLAFAAGSQIGALMAGRTVVIRLLRHKQASTLKEMAEKGIITPALYGGADQLRLWADIVGHEDIEAKDINAGEVGDILDYLGTVLEAVYTHQARVDRFVARTEKLKVKPSNKKVKPSFDRGS